MVAVALAAEYLAPLIECLFNEHSSWLLLRFSNKSGLFESCAAVVLAVSLPLSADGDDDDNDVDVFDAFAFVVVKDEVVSSLLLLMAVSRHKRVLVRIRAEG